MRHFLLNVTILALSLIFASCDDKIEDEPDAGDGGCDEECDDTDWD